MNEVRELKSTTNVIKNLLNIDAFTQLTDDDLTLLKNNVQSRIEKKNHSETKSNQLVLDQEPQKETLNTFK